ncbi:hypothetical protein [Homoserinimonas sp. A520]
MERDLSDLQLYGAEDFEELDMILDALEKANEVDLRDEVAK